MGGWVGACVRADYYFTAHLQCFLEHGGPCQEENSRGGFELSLPQQDVGVFLRHRSSPRRAKVVREELLKALALRGTLGWHVSSRQGKGWWWGKV